MALMTQLFQHWGSIYSNHAALRTAIGFAHLAGLVLGGGSAVMADRMTLAAARLDATAREAQLRVIGGTHRVVVVSLTIIIASGLLLAAADTDTFLVSKFFWAKMALVAMLLANGALLMRAEQQAAAGDERGWRRLKTTAIASLALWFLTTLGGAALPNIG